ncbi:putative HTH-type transcriptional regulator [compost metagenome]
MGRDHCDMDIYDIRRKNLRALMKSRFNGKQALLAAALERPANYISRCLSSSPNPASRKNIGEEFARDIEDRLKLRRHQLDSLDLSAEVQGDDASDAGSNVRPMLQPHREAKEYPLISWIAAGGWAESCDNFQPGDAAEWIESHINAGPHGYWLEIEGESMIPPQGFAFTPGMRILVRPEGFDLISGKLYIALLHEPGGRRETTFKQYVRDAGVEYLRPLNPTFKTLEMTEHVQIIGRVIDARPPRSVF